MGQLKSKVRTPAFCPASTGRTQVWLVGGLDTFAVDLNESCQNCILADTLTVRGSAG
jgi:hypothetical protein